MPSLQQIPLVFKCHAPVTYKHQVQARNFAIAKDEKFESQPKEHNYSAIFEFSGDKEEQTILHVTGRGICPQVKLSN